MALSPAQVIKELRKHMTIEEIADRTKISPAAVSKIANEKTLNPSYTIVDKLRQLLTGQEEQHD